MKFVSNSVGCPLPESQRPWAYKGAHLVELHRNKATMERVSGEVDRTRIAIGGK